MYFFLGTLGQSGEPGHDPTRERTVTVPALQNTEESPACVRFGEPERITRETAVEGRWDVPTMPRHRWIFVFASVETAATQRHVQQANLGPV